MDLKNGIADKEGLLSIEGSVEKIIYQNEENGYTVCEIFTPSDEIFTLVGNMPYLSEGETVSALGSWVNHATFGKQFKVEFYEKQLPATETAILKYLASGAVRGIGKVTAQRIVSQFGADSFEVIEHNPQWLSEIPGISPKKAEQISASFAAQFGMRNVMMFCREYFGPTTAVRIYKKWGNGAVERIKQNPYILCGEIYGVGFEKADAIAKDLGMKKNAPERIAMGLKYVLMHNAASNGHSFLPLDKLCAVAKRLLSCEMNEIEDEAAALETRGEIVCVRHEGMKCAYLRDYYEAEKYTAEKLCALDRAGKNLGEDNVLSLISMVERESNMEYAVLQKRAICQAASNGVFILTGGPGTGKTTVVRAIIRVFDAMGLRIALAAPTGRAAKRMSQSAGEEAKTVHRLLEMEYGAEDKLRFRKNEKDQLEDDVIIIDEASMLDLMLTDALLKAIKPGARLILIGDVNQLPPVGAGHVFDDIIKSDRFATVELTHIFRQAQESLIVTNAHAVNHGEYMNLESKSGDFFFLPRQEDAQTAATIAELCKKRLPKSYGLTVFDGIQVITPSRKGDAGTEMLNSALQSVINPPTRGKAEKKVRDFTLREGDKVMQIKNNYDIEWNKNGTQGFGIFNGDIGVIKKIDLSEELITVDFEDKICEYDYTMLDELELAYAITVHKSQGSEYPIVIMPLYRYTPKLLTRNLLYTAITRAQSIVILVGNGEVAKAMVDNNRQTKRYTGLRYALEKYD
ncbi:MAG TPA: ATP-dependent RecD-like DNA helicase [Clostridiales bacterium]|nr:ATP-dependent RecD-like DNA helicase [Candidatus Apopatosoma intestinale]HBO65806.1 ATP-dependent RecD-like DNA helicase [Candidatus Apopatosoma intestinale]